MSATWRAAAERVAADLQHVFSTRLRAVVAYGPRIEAIEEEPVSTLALVDRLTGEDLDRCAAVADRWRTAGAAIPLLLPVDEFRRSLDAFPLEFADILRAHERVFGEDPFVGLAVTPEDGRRACEHQCRSHLVHLREGFLEAGGRPEAVAALITASAPAFIALLRTVAGLSTGARLHRLDAALAGARAAGISERLVRDLLTLERPSGIAAADAARLFPDYLASVERLVRTVDGWHS